ncbi:thioesterase II family protein [Methylogaea oryzae]|uniref:Thioesterase n=2 Tax=Methylogaea oryzae TaxID=1295382 RepID=A0A8D5AKC1_9GAMM|nr:alpha/beta fold hydrolase [Methylogaea oryzae]BBL70966.1 thioesterase [Methylogaea oryzae]
MNAPHSEPWRNSDDTRWLVGPPRRSDATLRLVCIPHAGGGASFFRPWAQRLPPRVELWIAQLPGREGRFREPLAASLTAVAEALGQCLARLPAKPTVLFGHSLGALAAFELAHVLRDLGQEEPLLLAPSGRTPPGDGSGPRHLLHLDDAAFIDALADEYGGIAPAILENPALRELYVPTLRADMGLVADYRPPQRPPLSCPIRAFGGDGDRHTPTQRLQGWQDCSRGPFDMRLFPGGHFYLADQIAAVIDSLLDHPSLS